MIAADLYFPATGMPDKDWWHALWPNPEQVAAKFGIWHSMTVVDLCCGDGYFTAPIARLASAGQVIAIDLDRPLLDAARAACRGLSNCIFVEGDARNLGTLVAEPVDYVLRFGHGCSLGVLATALG
jgi:ubiquinone/menaquinone biosynthesis C-methylase UbiE